MFWRRIRGRKIDHPEALAEALMAEASLVAQKCLIGYCHARTMLPLNELMRERRFAEAFEHARTESVLAVLADFVVVVEGRLREAAGARAEAVADRLVRLFGETARAQPALARADIPGAQQRLGERLRAAQIRAPAGSAEVAAVSGQRLFETLPIHERLRRADRNSVVASVRFMLMARSQLLDRRLDASGLAASLAADA